MPPKVILGSAKPRPNLSINLSKPQARPPVGNISAGAKPSSSPVILSRGNSSGAPSASINLHKPYPSERVTVAAVPAKPLPKTPQKSPVKTPKQAAPKSKALNMNTIKAALKQRLTHIGKVYKDTLDDHLGLSAAAHVLTTLDLWSIFYYWLMKRYGGFGSYTTDEPEETIQESSSPVEQAQDISEDSAPAAPADDQPVQEESTNDDRPAVSSTPTGDENATKPPTDKASEPFDYSKLLGTGAGLAGAAGLYALGGKIKGLKRKKNRLLRAVLALTGGAGIGYGVYKAAQPKVASYNEFKQNKRTCYE